MATPAPLLTRVDFVSVPTQDFEAAKDFYGNVLGLPCSVVYENLPGGEFETGNLTLAVLDPRAIGLEFSRNANTIALHVDDMAAARAELESRGVAFHGDVLDTGVCYMSFFADRDGNALMLHHNYARGGS